MIIKCIFKTLGAGSELVEEAVQQEMKNEGLRKMDEAWDEEFDRRCVAARVALARFIKYDEYLWVDIDTVTGEAKVNLIRD